jgi:hypothetical protein
MEHSPLTAGCPYILMVDSRSAPVFPASVVLRAWKLPDSLPPTAAGAEYRTGAISSCHRPDDKSNNRVHSREETLDLAKKPAAAITETKAIVIANDLECPSPPAQSTPCPKSMPNLPPIDSALRT